MRRLLDEDDSLRNTDRMAMRRGARMLKQAERSHRAQAVPADKVRRREAAGRCCPPGHRQRDRRGSRGAESFHRQPSAGRWCRESRHSIEEDSLSGWVRPERDRADGIADPSKRAFALIRSIDVWTSNRHPASRVQPLSDCRDSPDNRRKLPRPDEHPKHQWPAGTRTTNCP